MQWPRIKSSFTPIFYLHNSSINGLFYCLNMIIFILSIIVTCANGYPFGAPPGVCTLDSPMPNHSSHSPQKTSLPFDISMSKDQLTSVQDSITVSIKSKPGGPAFRGFLVLPKDDLGPFGTWDNDAVSHPIEGCSATTHDNRTPKDKVQLTWRPGTKLPTGRIRMTAVIVQQFDTYWVDIQVPVEGSTVSGQQFPVQITSTATVSTSTPTTTKTTNKLPIGGIALPGLKGSPNIETSTVTLPTTKTTSAQTTFTTTIKPTTTTTTATTTKRKSLIQRIFGGGDKTTKPTTTSTSTTTTTTPTTTTTTTTIPTTTTTTTTPSTPTTKKKSLISRLFGGNDSKKSKTETTQTSTITQTTEPPTTQTTSTTTSTPTTTKGSFIKRLLG